MRVLPAIALFVAGTALAAQEPERIVDLHAALAAGDVYVTDVRGTGNSSGSALTASFRNTTGRTLRVAVGLSRGLYLAPRRAGAQNMIATAVYGRDGRYWEGDGEAFIEVPPNGPMWVTLNAYCLDFERENPEATDVLVAQHVPPHLSEIVRKLLVYERSPEGQTEHSTVRAQVALWLAQGQTAGKIRERFRFTDADLVAAYRILSGF